MGVDASCASLDINMTPHPALPMSEGKKVLDATGLFCPEPVFRTKIEIEKMQVGEILMVTADDPAAEEDISRWVSRNGHELLNVSRDGRAITFSIKKTK